MIAQRGPRSNTSQIVVLVIVSIGLFAGLLALCSWAVTWQ